MKSESIKNKFQRIEKSGNYIEITIGEYYASKDPLIIKTLLGSCVSVCLYDWKNKTGGMNHIFLPGKTENSRFSDSARYSINAMELLINSMLKLGADKKKMIAKVFGGANVISVISENHSVGSKISEFVLDFLKTERINVAAQDLGGTKTRKLFFNTETGEVFLKRSSSSYRHLEELRIKREKAIQIRDNITLFE